jgi:protein-S-isoprenylcysteine O-methyltransferase Ste14
MLAGIALRWRAMTTLGEYFTGEVQILEEQRLIRCGLFRHVPQPLYTGALVAHLGLGISSVNWISSVLIFFPVLFAALRRIWVEEEALRQALGNEDVEYSGQTKPLLPWIY